ncbi:MAG TPA: hypothetical protein VGH40_22310 [Roseiarcus sp.]|jgi:hypothetical protein
MFTRVWVGGTAAAVAGAAMLAISATSASAFTLSSPSLEQSMASSQIDHVWWDRWGRWHPNHPFWGWGPHRHCWRGYYGRLHCAW